MIKINIDLSKIDKNRIKVTDKGKFIDLMIIPTPNGKYGDHMVVESISKEEREEGKKGNILGNGKNIGR